MLACFRCAEAQVDLPLSLLRLLRKGIWSTIAMDRRCCRRQGQVVILASSTGYKSATSLLARVLVECGGVLGVVVPASGSSCRATVFASNFGGIASMPNSGMRPFTRQAGVESETGDYYVSPCCGGGCGSSWLE